VKFVASQAFLGAWPTAIERLIVGHNRQAVDLAVQRVTALRQFRRAKAESLDSPRIENQSAGSPISDEQAHLGIRFNPADIKPAIDVHHGSGSKAERSVRQHADGGGDIGRFILYSLPASRRTLASFRRWQIG
jgi:hypothetical protein